MKKFTLIIVLLYASSIFSQFSKTHYIPPVSHADTQAPQGQYMYISCPSTTNVNFQIKPIGGTIISGTVSRDLPYVYNIGSGFATQMMIDRSAVNQIMNDKGFIVEADDLIYVAVRMTSTPLNYQAGSIVSKGLAALGRQFRIGAFENTFAPSTTQDHYTFATILATENNTTISFGSIKPGVVLINNVAAGNTPNSIVLNQGQSFAIATEAQSVVANKDGLIGASITSDKDIVVNCGSFAGSNSNTTNLDLGMDQIVSAERTGTKYIFVRGEGIDVTERPMVVADQNNTDVFINGGTTPVITLAAGEYRSFSGLDFSANKNMFIETSKPVFAYQSLGGTNNPANQNMHFVPPLSCGTPKSINNIPLINEIGGLTDFIGTLCVVAETAAQLSFIINGIPYPTIASLPTNIIKTGPLAVTGNTQFETYTFSGFTGNISIFSTSQVYVSYYGTSGAATYGGFYSGFTFDPEISFILPTSSTTGGCLGNVKLEVNALSSFDDFQWFKNGVAQATATNNFYTPSSPGYYFVRGKITACGIAGVPYDSVEIPVSECPKDIDQDGINDGIDIDLDNDGISNCSESFGNLTINTTNPAAGNVNAASANINVQPYTNSYLGTTTTSGPTIPAGTFTGGANSFVMQVPVGKKNKIVYKTDFLKPISLSLEYPSVVNNANLLNSDANFIVNCSQNNTITVLNPTNQLLIDTNYDGNYESGVTQYSGFEIRFRLNSATPLAAGTGTFRFRTNLTSSFSITQENVSDINTNRATFTLIASCLPRDSDGDSIPDNLDYDSDNDGVKDLTENVGSFYDTYLTTLQTDTNKNGLYDFFETNFMIADYDNDLIQNYLDLDSDNDGIYDLLESGSGAIDANLDGIVDGNPSSFGTNGLSDSLETTTNSNNISYTLAISNNSVIPNFMNSDADNDGCPDVIEADFLDPNSDQYLGGLPIIVDSNGVVTSGVGYTIPSNNNYIISAPITITTQPIDNTTCELENSFFTINSNFVDGYQWQVSIDNGVTFVNISSNTIYSDANSQTLLLTNTPLSYNNYVYRVKLSKNGNTCGLISGNAKLMVNPKPVLTTPINYKQCDDDTDGINIFNLTLKNKEFSTNFANQTFKYFKTLNAANTDDNSELITNDTAFSNINNNTVWVRVTTNATLCFSVGQLNLIVSVTQLPPNYQKYFNECDDFLDVVNNDKDGISKFDFSSVTADVALIIPTSLNYTLKYYRNNADASSELNEITDISNYRNIGFPNFQQVIGRINSNTDNSCFGFVKVNLTVEKLPIINKINALDVLRVCDSDQDQIFDVDTSGIQALLIGTQTGVTVSYTDGAGNALSSPLPNPLFVNLSTTINVKVTNNVSATLQKSCFSTYTFDIVIDKLPTATAVASNLLTSCDDEVEPNMQDGKISFNTSTFETTILNGQTGMIVKYFDAAGNDISPLPNPFKTATQDVKVTVSNPLNSNCFATTTLSFVVNPRPKINLLGDELVCKNLPLLTKVLDAGITDGSPTSDYNFIWKKDGIFLTNTNPTLTINQGGLYTVQVINKLSLCENTRTVNVYASDIATFLPPTIIDLVENNTAIINVTGSGKYEYSLDDIDGPYQDSPVFDNIPIGIHEVYVNDIYKCGVVKQQLNIIGAPKFFTPNNDGINDYWNIKGLDSNNNYNSVVTIYDRFGKLIKRFSTSEIGWDGKFNEQELLSDDYWFTLELKDGRFTKGHFSLKR